MATLGDGFKDIFLAGIGAMAITVEKSKELVDQLISKGELTVDQGKQINTELKHKVDQAASSVRDDILEASIAAMSPEDRAAFVAKAAEFAAKANAAASAGAEEGSEAGTSVEADSPNSAQSPVTAGAPPTAPQAPGA